jgi:hypothetical protein
LKGLSYRDLLRWVALPVTDRRWAAPLSAVALGFGLFVGVAIGPGASGTFATGSAPIIEIPALAVSEDDGGDESEAPTSEARPSGAGEAPAPPASEEAESTFPVASAPLEESGPSEEPARDPESPEEEEGEPEEEPLTLKGVVVHANPAAGSYTVAEPSGALSPVHAGKLPSPGTRVSIPLRTLANGTFAEDGTRRRLGIAVKAKLEGTVTYVDADAAAPGYVVSKRGISMLVRVQPDPAGAVPPLPSLGAFVKVDVKIEKPPPAVPAEEVPPATPEAPTPEPHLCEGAPVQPPYVPAAAATLWQTGIESSGTPFAYADFAAVVVAVCPGQRELAISADDLREGGADLFVSVPARISVEDLEPGDSVLATAEIAEDGRLTLAGLASDERTKGADDAATARGDLVSHLAERPAPRAARQAASRSSSATSASTRAAISSRVARTISSGWSFGSGRSQSR